jgi:hypothetical protein
MRLIEIKTPKPAFGRHESRHDVMKSQATAAPPSSVMNSRRLIQ